MKNGLILAAMAALAVAFGFLFPPAGAADDTIEPRAPLHIAQASALGGAVEVLRREPGDTLRLISRPLKSYSVYLISMSGYAIERVRVDGGKWLSGPGEGRTCERRDYDWCHENRQWTRIAMVNCGREHTLEVRMTDARGNRFGLGEPWRFSADCDAEGGAFGL